MKWKLITVVALCLAAIAGVWAYRVKTAPTKSAQQAADRFWSAVMAGDAGTVQAMLAPEADFTPAEVIASHRGFCFGGNCGQGEDVHWVMGPSLTGAEVLVNTLVRDQAKMPHGRTLAMKRVGGEWKVTRQGTSFAF